MTVEELIEQLKQYDPDSEIELEVEIGNETYWMTCVSTYFFERLAEGGFDFTVLSNRTNGKFAS